MSNQNTGRSKTRMNALMFTLVLEELTSGPSTAEALCAHSGLERKTVWLLMRTMCEHNLAHIAGWEKDSMGRIAIKVYGFGPGRNVKKPTKSNAQACRDFRERQKAAALGQAFAAANDSSNREAA